MKTKARKNLPTECDIQEILNIFPEKPVMLADIAAVIYLPFCSCRNSERNFGRKERGE